MATYGYRCPRDGDFELVFPIGRATTHAACEVCGGAAPRVYTAPLLSRTPRPLAAAIERAAGTAETPEVVPEPPARPKTPRPPAVPARARLPRP